MTDNRTTELMPCPFCGGEAELKEYKPNVSGVAICKECGARSPICKNDHTGGWRPKAVEAWNTRADYYGYEKAAIEAWKSIKAWNQRHVETCRITASSTDGLCSDNPRHYFELSCGHSFTINGLDAPVACAVCGKVVKNAD